MTLPAFYYFGVLGVWPLGERVAEDPARAG